MEQLDHQILSLISILYSRPREMQSYIYDYIVVNGCIADELFYKEIKEHANWFIGNGIQDTKRSRRTKKLIDDYCNSEIESLKLISWRNEPPRKELKYVSEPIENIDKIKNIREETVRQHKGVFDKKENSITEKHTTIHAQNVIIDNKGTIGNVNQSNKSEIHAPIKKTNSAAMKIIITLIISIVSAVIAGYFLHRMGWV